MQKNTSILKIAIIAIILIITISIIYLVIPKDKEKKLKKIETPINLKFEDIIQNNISNTCKICKSQVNVKATTEECLGFTGRLEGIAAHAVCLLI